ncbi:FAD binding domain-containing protein [Mesorhizobium sp. 1B3]|uniref:FAD binding domain-containing protein n=1 Tax=Mesorhizobium sp. 1B3 TaxID=3243599 RepID=UPI003D98B2E1
MLQAVVVPGSLAEAQAVLGSRESAAIIAGGTAVMPLLNYGTDDFTTLVSLRRAGLSGISIDAGEASIGAATTLAALESDDRLAFLWPALDAMASPTIRNMATVGGNLFVKQPYGDLAACLVALGASASIAAPKGMRVAPVEQVVRGLEHEEIVTGVSFPLPPSGSFRFAKAGRKTVNSAAVVTVAALVSLADGLVTECRIALGGVGPHAMRAPSVEKALVGRSFDRANVEAAAKRAVNDIAPLDDAYASAWYRARVTPVHIRRALLGE